MRLLSGILRIMAYAVYAIIIIILAIASPLLLGYKPVIVLSGSMEPSYPVGSVTYYKSVEFEEIEVGDAITFDLGEDSLATHRVVEINEVDQAFITKGDNNETNDANEVSYTEVQGKVTEIAIPYAGYFVDSVNSVEVIGTCAFILVLDIIFGKGDKEDKKKKKDMKEVTT